MRIALTVCLLALLIAPPAGAATHIIAPAPAWQWPIPGAAVVRGFDPPPKPWMAGHRGVDLAARELTVVAAAGDGVVAFAGFVATRPLVSIDHPNGLRTTYEPIEPLVSAGDRVSAGDPIGRLLNGHSGSLHWGLKRGDTYLDPLALVGRARVRLLPVTHPRPAGHRPRRHRPFRLLRI